MRIRFAIPGNPFGKMRPRRGKNAMYDPRENAEYEARVREAYLRDVGMVPKPTDEPIWMNITLLYPIPKRCPKKRREAMIDGKILPLGKPDADNCAKSIMDALNGFYYQDDKQVVELRVKKQYSETPQTIVYVGRYYR